MVWVDGITGSGTTWGAQHHGLVEDDVVAGSETASQAWGWRLRGRRCYRLQSGKMAVRKGPWPWSGTTVRRLQGGLDDGAGSREIFSQKFWHPDGVSESLRELRFVKVAQRFIYIGSTVAMGIGDVSRAIATENHNSDGRLPSSARWCDSYIYIIILK
jgi:hypothetical protein